MRIKWLAFSAAPMLLSACGGGDGGTTPPPQTAPAPPPTPAPPPPPPTPTPPPTYDTQEYRDSAGSSAGAITAYNAGATGKGITVGIVDSGIDVNNAEFAGRISPASADVVANRGVQDGDFHGTAVAGVLAAAHNGSGIEGVAFDATIVALRADAVGSCPKCNFDDDAIARGVDAAVAAGARVINISLGGSPAAPALVAALSRATHANVLVVIAAGNDSKTEVDPLALIALDPATANGAILVAGAVDSTKALASFSNQAGTAQNVYLAALGVSVLSFKPGGAEYYFGGTSFSTPVIVGAAALLAQAFPNLTAQQIATLLLSTADDAGAPGTDAVYGRGILDIAKAFQPQGAMSVAGSGVPVAGGANAVGGGALGSGSQIGHALGGVVVFDGYKRAYKLDLGRTIAHAPAPGLAGALFAQSRSVTLGGAARNLAFSVAPGAGNRPELGLAQQGLDAIGTGGAARAGTASLSLWKGADVTLGFGTGFAAMSEGSAASTETFLVAPAAGLDRATGFAQSRGVSAVQRLGAWAVSLGAGASEGYAVVRALQPLRTNEWRVGAARRLGRATFGVSVAGRDETGGLLGSNFGPAFGIMRARTTTLGLDGGFALAGGWRFGASARHGWTQAATGTGLVRGIDGLRSFGWRLDAAKDDVFARGDRFALRIVQPMRVVDGVARLSVPVGYDYATGVVTSEVRAAGLAPGGTERDMEAVYRRDLGWGGVSGHAFLRTEPADVAGARSDTGAALTLDAAF